MWQVSDQVLAQRMLMHRERGYTLGAFVRSQWRRYLVFVGYFSLAALALSYYQAWTLAALVGGLFCGAVLRDVAWISTVKRTWPFSEKTTDWPLVGSVEIVPLSRLMSKGTRWPSRLRSLPSGIASWPVS